MDNKFEYVSIKNALIVIQCEPFPFMIYLPARRVDTEQVRIRIVVQLDPKPQLQDQIH